MTVKQIAVRLPRLLDKDLGEVRRLRPSGQSIEMNITPLSTASLTLDDKSGVPFRSFVELYNAKGSAGIYRVCRPDESYGSGIRLELEHGICTLDDAVVHGKGEIGGTPQSVLENILAHQTTKARGQNMWVVGTVEAVGTVTVEHDGTKTLEMLVRLIGVLEGYMLTFDQSGFPWRVNVVRKPTEASCEGRLSRNIRTIRKTIDDSDLCTRLYCGQLNGGFIESDTIDAWGAVEQEVSLNDDTPQSDAQAFCRRYLENRKNPTVSIEVDALEWYAMTGERLDRFEIGDICRLALPDYGVTLEERIVSLGYMDAIGRPEAVTVTLANQIKDLSMKTAETSRDIENLKSTSTIYGNRLSASENNITNLKNADEGFKKVDNKIVKWFSSAEIDLDADKTGANVGILATYKETHDLVSGVDARVAEAELILHGGPDGATTGLVARVEENETEISKAALTLYGDTEHAQAGLVTSFNELSGAYLEFESNAEVAFAQIGTRFEEVEGDVSAQAEAFATFESNSKEAQAAIEARFGENEAAITATADELGSKVSIEALEIELNGYVTAERLKTEFTNFESGISESLYVSALSANTFECSDLTVGSVGIGMKRRTIMTSGKVTEGSTYSNYTVYNNGTKVGTVNIPSTWKFTPTFGDEIFYLSWE